MTNFSQNAINIIERLKEVFNLLNDSKLANFLGVSQNTISTWKARNKIDYELVISKCEGIFSLNYILWGIGEKELSQIEKLDNSNISQNEIANKKNTENSEKSNKKDKGEYQKSYALEENYNVNIVKEKEQKTSKSYGYKANYQGLSFSDVEFLKKEIIYLKEIIRGKEELLKSKDKQIELLEDKIKNFEYKK